MFDCIGEMLSECFWLVSWLEELAVEFSGVMDKIGGVAVCIPEGFYTPNDGASGYARLGWDK